jgi:hypothetical protein
MKMTIIPLAMALVVLMVGCNAPASHDISRSGTASPRLYRSQFSTLPDSDERFWWHIDSDRKLRYEPCSGSYDISILSETPSRLVFKVVRGYGRLRDLRDGRVVSESDVVGKTFEVKLAQGKVISTQEQK